jgi:hypothetical protein
MSFAEVQRKGLASVNLTMQTLHHHRPSQKDAMECKAGIVELDRLGKLSILLQRCEPVQQHEASWVWIFISFYPKLQLMPLTMRITLTLMRLTLI